MIKWNIDPANSSVGFKVNHTLFSFVEGNFRKFNVQVLTEDEDFSSLKVFFTAEVNSLYTGNEKRDQHLKSSLFLDADKYPFIKFESNGYDGDDLVGNLTINHITRQVKFEVEFCGVVKYPWKTKKAGFNIFGKVNRRAFGLHFRNTIDKGILLVNGEVDVFANVMLYAA